MLFRYVIADCCITIEKPEPFAALPGSVCAGTVSWPVWQLVLRAAGKFMISMSLFLDEPVLFVVACFFPDILQGHTLF